MQPAHTSPQFRLDINGLRAWAVVAVVLYHFGVPGFSGGFVGVDVFFVISGFLMTGMVVKPLERGTFSVRGFYLARARRIVPALLVLCAVLLALGWWVLLPPDYKLLASHSAYAASFLSNVEFWQEAGYFDVASHEKWLLHTWSLSVEWQFYLLLPVAVWAFWRWRPGRAALAWAVGVVLLVSLVASVWVTQSQPSMAFYWIHTRAWEMLAGGLVFLWGTPVIARNVVTRQSLNPVIASAARQSRVLEGLGLAMIVLSVAVFDADTVWPGWRALLPVVAAMLVLLAQRRSVWTGHALAQWLGDRSYSLYLWHWPVVVALGYLGLRGSAWAVVAALGLTALLGHVSYQWVETPSRRWLQGARTPQALWGLGVAVALVLVPAVLVWKQQGVVGRFAPAVELAAAEANNGNPRREECHPGKGSSSPSCVYGGAQWRVIALGDSHVSAVVSALAQAGGSDAGVVQWSYSGCSYVPGMRKTAKGVKASGSADYRCEDFNAWATQRLYDVLAAVPVVLINRYAMQAMGRNEDGQDGIPDVFFSTEYPRTTPEFLREFADHITRSACELARQRTVYLVRPIPEMGFSVPQTLSRRMAFGATGDVSIPIEDYRQRNAWVWAAQDEAARQCGAKILDPTAVLCHDGRCWGSRNARPLYSDDDHLSEYGNKLLVPMFRQVYEDLAR